MRRRAAEVSASALAAAAAADARPARREACVREERAAEAFFANARRRGERAIGPGTREERWGLIPMSA